MSIMNNNNNDNEKEGGRKMVENGDENCIKAELSANYIKAIEEAFRKEKKDILYNSSKIHAAFIMEKLFSFAKKDIDVFTSGKDIAFYRGDCLRSVLSKINKNIKIRVLLEDDSCKKEFSEIFPKGTEFKILEKGYINSRFKASFSNEIEEFDREYETFKHFTVIDKRAYRIEKPHAQDIQNSEIVDAVACVKSTHVAGILELIFSNIFKDHAQAIVFG